MTNTCIRCHTTFESFRASRYCSDACRQKVWRSGPGKSDTGIASVPLVSGNVKDTCNACGGVVVRAANAPQVACRWCGLPSGEPRPPTTTRTLAELACMWCNRALGWVPMTPSGMVLVPRSLRCPVCGGPPLATGEVEVQRADTSAEARKAFHGDPWAKRLGRPSKEIAEARRQALQVEW